MSINKLVYIMYCNEILLLMYFDFLSKISIWSWGRSYLNEKGLSKKHIYFLYIWFQPQGQNVINK